MANNQIDYSKEYFTIVALEDGLTAKLSANTCEYRIDNGEWISLTKDTATTSINSGQKISFKITNPTISRSGIGTFTVNKAFNVEGNIMSLLYGDDFEGQIDLSGKNYDFYNLFKNCTTVKNAGNLILPATELTNECYHYMFFGCTGLTTAPELPATTLADECYNGMFSDCTGLTTAPELPATELANGCYWYMFNGCTGLTTAPELPATTLANGCYNGMFNGCTGLTTAPELPATTLADHCYNSMFNGCSKLNYIKMLATDISASYCLNNWVNGVASSGTFVKNINIDSLPTGTNGIPTGWTVEDYGEIVIDYSKKNFTIIALEDGLTVKLSRNACEYRIDNGEWISLAKDTATPSINSGQKISFKITNPTILSSYGIGTFTVNKAFNVEGNIMSLLYGDNFERQISLSGKNYDFYNLFKNCTTVKNAGNLILPATTLASYCYYSMFSGCTGLTTAPELPATELTNECYRYMFNGCTGLTTAPELPATTLADECYYSMFSGCTGLTTAPELPATTLASYCYNGMFSDCTGLTTAPELPATELANECYSNMFYSCTGLTTAPELPATTLASYCYNGMFSDCTGLTTAPELPATTLASRCYGNMFHNCNKLNYIKMLATDISASNCLNDWVNGVASSGTFVKNAAMTTLPSGVSGIPNGWTVLNIFNNISPCIINQASESITFVYSDGLFTPTNEIIDLSQHLTKEELLSVQPECEITVTLQDKTDNVLVSDYVWANNKTLGDVLNELGITNNVYDINVIITNVNTPEDSGYYYYMLDETEPFVKKDWMRIVSLVDDNTISLSKDIQYSVNGDDWRKLYAGNQITVNSDDIVYFKGINIKNRFTVNKAFNVEGNIMSLLYGDDFEGQIDLSGKNRACLYELFYNCTTLQSAENLILPATTLADNCYAGMFHYCTSLTTAPEILPATTLAVSCYSSMFSGCTSLTTAPTLPATTLTVSCYEQMFSGCTSLTTAPTLPATTLANSCYNSMFYDCTSLTTAPEILPATTLAVSCYSSMFSGCTSLTTAPTLPATTLAERCYFYMFSGTSLITAPELPATTLAVSCYNSMFRYCTSLTTGPSILPATTLASRCYEQMFQKCINLTTAPVLPATTLTSYCYYWMFLECKKLNKITMLATDISANECLGYWVSSVADTGTFVKHKDMTSLPSGDNGIPTGWTVKNYNENISNKKYLDKAGLEILWGIIKDHLATKADKAAAVGSFSDTVYTATNATINVTAVDGTTALDTIVLNTATTDKAGLMSAADKANLDSLKETIDANTDFKGLKINDVQIATADAANLKIEYVAKTETTNAKIKLYDVNNDKAVSEIDVSDFIKDGMISSVDIVEHDGKKQIKLEWNTEAGKDVTYIPVDDIVKTYSVGEGLTLSDNEFSLKQADTELGGIKTGYTEVEGEQKYAITTDNDDNAYVAVPWENDNTEYSATDSNTYVKLEQNGTVFSINETALAGTIEDFNTTKIDSFDGDDYITASVDGTEAKVSATDTLTDAINNANSAVQSASGDTYIAASVDGTEVKVAVTDTLTDAVNNANSAIQDVNGVADDLVTVTDKSNNTVSVYASDALKTAVAAANSAVQSAFGDTYVDASVDDTEVKVAATDTLTDAVNNANSALQEITISSIELSKTNNTVEHDEFIGYFAITEDDLNKICS